MVATDIALQAMPYYITALCRQGRQWLLLLLNQLFRKFFFYLFLRICASRYCSLHVPQLQDQALPGNGTLRAHLKGKRISTVAVWRHGWIRFLLSISSHCCFRTESPLTHQLPQFWIDWVNLLEPPKDRKWQQAISLFHFFWSVTNHLGTQAMPGSLCCAVPVCRGLAPRSAGHSDAAAMVDVVDVPRQVAAVARRPRCDDGDAPGGRFRFQSEGWGIWHRFIYDDLRHLSSFKADDHLGLCNPR